MVYGHQIMRGKSPQVAGDEATPRVHIQASRQSCRLTERIPLLNFLNPLFIPQSFTLSPASVKQGGICRAVYRASQSLGGLGPLSSCAQRQFCKRATPFHDPAPRKFLQFHATRLWCGAEPDTSPPGAGMRYSRCAVYWSYPRVEHQIVRPPSFESDRW